MSTIAVRRSALAMACALSLTLVGAVPAEADLARCSNCIVAADIATNGVGRAEIGPGAVAGSEIADRSIGTRDLGFDPATQAELHALNRAIAAPADVTSSTVSTDGSVLPSAVMGVDGKHLITSYDSGTGDLWVTHCSDVRCTAATSARVLTAGGTSADITIGRDGLGLIAYRWGGALRVAHCTNVVCNAVTTTTVETGGIGSEPDIAIGGDGFGVIAYHDATNTALKVAHCWDVACTVWQTTTVEADNDVGSRPSIAVGVDGFPIISHIDETNDDLRIVHCTNVTCGTFTARTGIEPGRISGDATEGGAQMAIASNGLPMFIYRDSVSDDLQAVRCSTVSCSSFASISVLDESGAAGAFASLTIGADGLAVAASFERDTQALRISHCADVSCAQSTTVTAASGGLDTSIVIDATGLPITFIRRNGVGLTAIRCPNQFCAPYFRR